MCPKFLLRLVHFSPSLRERIFTHLILARIFDKSFCLRVTHKVRINTSFSSLRVSGVFCVNRGSSEITGLARPSEIRAWAPFDARARVPHFERVTCTRVCDKTGRHSDGQTLARRRRVVLGQANKCHNPRRTAVLRSGAPFGSFDRFTWKDTKSSEETRSS